MHESEHVCLDWRLVGSLGDTIGLGQVVARVALVLFVWSRIWRLFGPLPRNQVWQRQKVLHVNIMSVVIYSAN